MQSLQSLTATDQIPSLSLLVLQRLGPGLGQGQNLIDELPETIGSHPLRQRIHRQQTTDAAGLHRCIAALKHLDQRLLKGEPIATVLDQTTDRHRRPRRIETLLTLEIGR